MTRRSWSGAASLGAAGLALATLALATLAGAAHAKGAEPPPDLSGVWQLDPSRSDQPRMPEGGPGHRRGMWGGWGGHGGGMRGPSDMPGADGEGMGGGEGGPPGGEGGPPGDEGGAPGGEGGADAYRHRRAAGDSAFAFGPRPVRLPERLRIEQSGQLVTFADSAGAVVQEIGVGAAVTDTAAHGAVQAIGEWEKGKLVVERSGLGGAKVTETYELGDGGRSLEVRTRIASDGPMPTIRFKRTYVRVAADSNAEDKR